VPLAGPSDVRAWFAERVSFVLPSAAEPLLDLWASEITLGRSQSVPGWRPEGPGRTPAEASTLIEFLRDHARRATPFTFNALRRESQGGRIYPFHIVGYDGALTISDNKYNAAAAGAGPRMLLAGIRRDVRAALQAPTGWSLLELDFKSCHAAIGLALSGDPQLGADLAGDIHQLTGDRLPGDLLTGDAATSAGRRDIGKAINNAMLFGLTPDGLQRRVQEALGRDFGEGAGERIWHAWWARYQRLAAFRDKLRAVVEQAQHDEVPFEIASPSGRVSRFSPADIAGRVAKGRAAPGPDGVWRTVFSACFRAVEGDLLDRTLHHFHQASAGGRPMLPLYDGGLFAAPGGAEVAVEHALQAAAAQAMVSWASAACTPP